MGGTAGVFVVVLLLVVVHYYYYYWVKDWNIGMWGMSCDSYEIRHFV